MESTDWSATDASNTQAVPAGAPNNFARTETKNIFRAIMGAVKRLRDRGNFTLTSAGTQPAYTLTPTGAVSAYVQGHRFGFILHSSLTGSATLNVSAVAAKKVFRMVGGIPTQVGAGDWILGQRVDVAYDTSLDSAAGGWWWINAPATLQMPRGYLAGLGTSRNSGTPTTKIDVAVGACRDATNAVDIVVVSTLTIDFTTTGANALDTGSLANTTWYRIWVISKADGATATAGFASTSASPTLPSGYVYKRQVGWVLTGGAATFLAYTQTGDYFRWAATAADISANNPGTSAVSRTLSVPVSTEADLLVGINGNTVFTAAYISPLSATDEAATGARSQVAMVPTASGSESAPVRCFVDTSSQARSRISFSDASVTLTISTIGFWFRRGRDD